MANISPFVYRHSEDWDDDLGNRGRVYTLVTANGDVEEVSYSVHEGGDRSYYWASENFVSNYNELLPVGDVLSWSNGDDMDEWISSMIYHSFIEMLEDNGAVRWFVKKYDYATANCRTFMPQVSNEESGDYAGETWVLFRNGTKVWPVLIVDNLLDDGWLMFWVDHNLQFGSQLIFGTQRKYIYDVIVLDRDLKRVYHDWVIPVSDSMSAPPLELNRLCTSWLPMIFARDSYILEFAYVYQNGISIAQVFNRHLEAFLRNPDVSEIDFCCGNHIATVPRVSGCLHSLRFRCFANALRLQPFDLVYVAVYDPTDARVIVFDSNGAERIFM